MKPSVCFRALIVLGALTCVAAIFGRIPLRAQAQSAQTLAARDVVVILRDQLAGTPPQRRAMQPRSAALASAQQDAMPNQTIHLILEATDDGTPTMTRYARVIITVRP